MYESDGSQSAGEFQVEYDEVLERRLVYETEEAVDFYAPAWELDHYVNRMLPPDFLKREGDDFSEDAPDALSVRLLQCPF